MSGKGGGEEVPFTYSVHMTAELNKPRGSPLDDALWIDCLNPDGTAARIWERTPDE